MPIRPRPPPTTSTRASRPSAPARGTVWTSVPRGARRALDAVVHPWLRRAHRPRGDARPLVVKGPPRIPRRAARDRRPRSREGGPGCRLGKDPAVMGPRRPALEPAHPGIAHHEKRPHGGRPDGDRQGGRRPGGDRRESRRPRSDRRGGRRPDGDRRARRCRPLRRARDRRHAEPVPSTGATTSTSPPTSCASLGRGPLEAPPAPGGGEGSGVSSPGPRALAGTPVPHPCPASCDPACYDPASYDPACCDPANDDPACYDPGCYGPSEVPAGALSSATRLPTLAVARRALPALPDPASGIEGPDPCRRRPWRLREADKSAASTRNPIEA